MSRRPWNIVLPVVFALVSGRLALESVLDFRSVGSHASIYTDAARAWLAGGDPWQVGPPAAIFAGPPPMLLPFVPFVGLPLDITRLVWVGGSLALAIWTLRRIGLPGYWLAFPPLFQAIQLGHPEVLVLWLLVSGGVASGLAAVIKPYAGFALLAERRWAAITLGLLVVAVTAAFLPWPRFVEDFPRISATLAEQSHGDSTFGVPLAMAVAVLALASLGVRRGLWLAAPVLWPSAQPIYKVTAIPWISPVLALFWAVPIPGATLAGLLAEVALLQAARRWHLPAWLESGTQPAGLARAPESPVPLSEPARLAARA
ncbi:MAG: DUF2029 domain-containing protein [Chloroflexi bacterium]|nr:MAG: DUF2029 domain-containing protein [Chloroflexota bacterium]